MYLYVFILTGSSFKNGTDKSMNDLIITGKNGNGCWGIFEETIWKPDCWYWNLGERGPWSGEWLYVERFNFASFIPLSLFEVSAWCTLVLECLYFGVGWEGEGVFGISVLVVKLQYATARFSNFRRLSSCEFSIFLF